MVSDELPTAELAEDSGGAWARPPVCAGYGSRLAIARATGQRPLVSTRLRAAAPRYYVHRRSKKHSAEIIGGSTLAGAGIGALVGGGKGALIGGLVGGGACTVYDRKTHKKRIDAVVALVMGLARAKMQKVLEDSGKTKSVYPTRGVRTV